MQRHLLITLAMLAGLLLSGCGRAEIERLHQQLAALQAEVARLEARSQQLETELEEERAARERAEAELALLRQRAAELGVDLEGGEPGNGGKNADPGGAAEDEGSQTVDQASAVADQVQRLPTRWREMVLEELEQRFGTPQNLVVWDALPLEPGEPDPAAGREPGGKLRLGRQVYHAQCVRCHGITGDGNGPEAEGLPRRPRDFRQGKFKFITTLALLRPSRHDLGETVRIGLPGTGMRAFGDELSDAEREAVVEYVRWLALRGEFEQYLARDVEDFQVSSPKQLDEFISPEIARSLSVKWERAEDPASTLAPATERPAASTESVMRGRTLYASERTKCHKCHGADGRGEPFKGLDVQDDWGHPAPMPDLTQGVFAGGDGPLDLFARIWIGIPGTPHPRYSGTASNRPTLSEAETWDVVNFVYDLAGTEPTPDSPTARRPPK